MRRLVIPTKEGSKYFEKMSLYDELPVFKASYDLLLSIFHFTANFKREFKYTVGEKLKAEAFAIVPEGRMIIARDASPGIKSDDSIYKSHRDDRSNLLIYLFSFVLTGLLFCNIPFNPGIEELDSSIQSLIFHIGICKRKSR